MTRASASRSAELIELGGLRQFVAMRGIGAGKPVLLVLHGGPGDPALPHFDRYCPELAEHFVVVHWDQRGAGRSYSRNIPAAAMTVDAVLGDALELCDLLCDRFDVDRVVIMGHSWGSYLGIKLAHGHPDRFSAYVGIGQVVDQAESETRSYAWATEQAAARGNKRARRALERGGPPVAGRYRDGLRGLATQRRWVREFGGAAHGRGNLATLALLGRPIMTCRDYRLRDKIAYLRGEAFSMRCLEEPLLDDPPTAFVDRLDVPIVVIQGADDRQTDTDLVEEFIAELDAPTKYLEIVDKAAHLVPFERPEAFLDIVRERLLPLVGCLGGSGRLLSSWFDLASRDQSSRRIRVPVGS